MLPFAWLDVGLEDEWFEAELEEGWLEEELVEGWLDELEEKLEGWLDELEDEPEELDLGLLDDLALPFDEDGLPDELEEVGFEELVPVMDREPSPRRGRPQLKGFDTFLPS